MDGSHQSVRGVETLEGRRFGARAVIITAGTFLRGKIHIGTDTRIAGGRAGEAATLHLAEQLEQAGLEVSRFKTGTPPRIDGRSVDYSALELQESEVESFRLLVVTLLGDTSATAGRHTSPGSDELLDHLSR